MPEYRNNDIIFNIEYHKKYSDNFNPKDDNESKQFNNSKWHRSKQAISYITRASACDDKLEDESKLFNDLLNFTDLEKDDIIEMSKIDYDNEIEKASGWSSLGELTEKNKLQLEEDLSNTGSTVWSSVISFLPEYSNEICSNRNEAKQLLGKVANDFFKSAGLDPENIEWYASFHNNTATHNHIHFVWFEKEPLIIDSKGNHKYSNSWIKKQSIDKMLKSIHEYHKDKMSNYFSLRDEIRNEIKSSVKQDYFEKILDDLSKSIDTSQSYQYARLSNEDKLKVNNAFKEILNHNPEMKDNYNNYIKHLIKYQKDLIKIWKIDNPDKKMKLS